MNEIMVQYIFTKYYEDEGLYFRGDGARDTIASKSCGQTGMYKIRDFISRLRASDVVSLTIYFWLDSLC
jgi:hypothetical protein